jgi:hypothetical protein
VSADARLPEDDGSGRFQPNRNADQEKDGPQYDDATKCRNEVEHSLSNAAHGD